MNSRLVRQAVASLQVKRGLMEFDLPRNRAIVAVNTCLAWDLLRAWGDPALRACRLAGLVPGSRRFPGGDPNDV